MSGQPWGPGRYLGTMLVLCVLAAVVFLFGEDALVVTNAGGYFAAWAALIGAGVLAAAGVVCLVIGVIAKGVEVGHRGRHGDRDHLA